MSQGYGIGSILNDTYRLERELGRGALGEVFAGAHIHEGREVALRLLPRPANEFLVERQRFLRDHKIVGQIDDARLPAIIECVSTPDDTLVVVSGLWRGETLRQRLRRSPLRPPAAFDLCDSLCQVLSAAHERGVPHGDVRPENIVFDRAGRLLLVDLGLHHFRIGALRTPRRAPGVGWYLPPEQIESRTREADPRGDVFALGALLYECITGRPAFPEAPQPGLGPPTRGRSGMMAILKAPPDGVPAADELVGALEWILGRACALRPEERLTDAGALRQALGALGGAFREEGGEERPASDSVPPGRRKQRRPLGMIGQLDGDGPLTPAPEPQAPAATGPSGAQADGTQASAEPSPRSAEPSPRPAEPKEPSPEGAEPAAAASQAPEATARAPEPTPQAPEEAPQVPGPAAQEPAVSAQASEAPVAAVAPPGPSPLDASAKVQAALPDAPPGLEPAADKPATKREPNVEAAGAPAPATSAPAAPAPAVPKEPPAPREPAPAPREPPRGSPAVSPVAARLAALARGEIPAPLPRPAPRTQPAQRSPGTTRRPVRDRDKDSPPAAEPAAPPPAEAPVPAQAPPPAAGAAEAAATAQAAGEAATPRFPSEQPASHAPSPAPVRSDGGLPTETGPESDLPVPKAPRDNSSPEAARAIAAARAAASQRLLLEAARKRAQNAQGRIEQAAAETPAKETARGPRRRAPANLVELPPAAGEVLATPSSAPTLEAPQIIIDLPDLVPEASQRPPPAPPPLPQAAAAESAASPDGRSVTDATTQRMREIAARSRNRGDEVKQTEQVEVLAPPEAPGRRGPLLAALSGLALAVLAGLALPRLLRPPPVPGAAPAVASVEVTGPERLLGEIDRALDVQDWRTAVLRADQVLRTYPGQPAATEKRRRAEVELQNQLRFDSFRAALERRNSDAALALFAEIPEDSVYKEKARGDALNLRAEYVQGKLAEARAARRLGLCAEVLRLTQAVLLHEPTNEEAIALEGKCDAREGKEARAEALPEPRRKADGDEPPRRKRMARRDQPSQLPSLKDLRDPFR